MSIENVAGYFDKIKTALKKRRYRLTVHCLERCLERSIEIEDIEQAALNGEIIEYYPEDKYGPSCLVFGHAKNKRPLHIQFSINPVWVITCYDPAEKKGKWSKDFRKRIKS